MPNLLRRGQRKSDVRYSNIISGQNRIFIVRATLNGGKFGCRSDPCISSKNWAQANLLTISVGRSNVNNSKPSTFPVTVYRSRATGVM